MHQRHFFLVLARGAGLLLLSLVLIIFNTIASCRGREGTTPHAAHAGAPSLALVKIASGLSRPVHITHAGDGSGRIFICEKEGVVRVLKDGKLLPTPFLDIKKEVRSSGSEQGLLSIAFPPDYAGKKHFYADYTGNSGIGDTVIARYRVSTAPERADSMEKILLKVKQPYQNHNGGQLAFGPDGYLYIGMGDGGSGGDPHKNAQNKKSLLGKLLRIDVESGGAPYAIPTNNPFGSEVWAYGLRNPWRFSFDRKTGDMYIADVGQDKYEEIDFQPAKSKGGENYGWNIMEGLHCFKKKSCSPSGTVLPVAEVKHGNGDCSVTGGFVYRGSAFPALEGIYLYGDFCSGRIWGLSRSGSAWENKLLLQTKLQISTFGEDEDGNIYVADYEAGDIYRIEAR